GNVRGTAELPMVVSPQRIRLSGIDRLDPTAVTRNLGARDVLIRLDREDFIFLISDTEAVVLRKQELQLMMNMAGMAQGTAGQPDPGLSVAETSETRTIHGYAARKIIMTNAAEQLEYHAWVTDDVDI